MAELKIIDGKVYEVQTTETSQQVTSEDYKKQMESLSEHLNSLPQTIEYYKNKYEECLKLEESLVEKKNNSKTLM